MTAKARLRALRLVGFKSFAEKTVVEFGPGISAVVGPNGSGKSNLADALRWALGEQGRGLRTRRSEDVIFAGSASRQATGMADVTLVIDNEDRLLPLDYTEIELGRRLYRSGENEYLLNRQRVRLRDLADLLDTANLAENAFLFIGQGMVDQALSLRPEERRPLFEEVAGVRRHERRRRQAEAQLAEAEANLARVGDILAEVRPQAKRLAAQARQQAARAEAAAELAVALVRNARERWREADAQTSTAARELASARSRADAAMADLRGAEERAASHLVALEERTDAERALRVQLERVTGESTELRLTLERLATQLGSVRRDRARLLAEQAAAEERADAARRATALEPPGVDRQLELDVAALGEQVAAAERQLAELEAGGASQAPEATAPIRPLEEEMRARSRDAEEAERRAAEQRSRTAAAAHAEDDAEKAFRSAAARLASEADALARAERELHDARVALEAAQGTRDARDARLRLAAEAAERAGARLRALEDALRSDEPEDLVRAAGRYGGKRLADGLDVDPALRGVVEAAMGAAVGAVAVPESAAVELRSRRGFLLIADDDENVHEPDDPSRAAVDAARRAGGGALVDALRRDPTGGAARVVRNALWVPELDAALRLRALLPPGWRVVTGSGEIVTADGLVELGRATRVLDARAERDRTAATVRDLERRLADATELAEAARASADERRQEWERARERVDEARSRARNAEEDERTAARRHETAAREHAWERSQLERSEGAARRASDALDALQEETSRLTAGPTAATEGTVTRRSAISDATRIQAAAARVRELADRRNAAAGVLEKQRAQVHVAEEARRRAEVALEIEEARLREVDSELGTLAAEEVRLAADVARITGSLSAAREAESQVTRELNEVLAVDADHRGRLADLEREAAIARERLRRAEEESRAAERTELDARLHLEAIREQLLVELAGLGATGLEALHREARTATASGSVATGAPAEPQLEAALRQVEQAWRQGASGRPEETSGPTGPAGRLAALRRRYHEVGATNPFAEQEYAELRQRLEELERQQADLESAIRATRDLIGELTRLVSEQFRTTFAALEGAFARRFEQLFGGGDARLTLTDPDDLSVTGVEITARPPGKKRQPLAMLSGGERALAAVALLFAMLEVRPVPFCVLDEVDAALDEANIARFSEALRGLAETIQFIVITHNRGTIEAADALYGITIGDDAVSRVISLRLSEAIELPVPERRAAAAPA